MTYHEILNALLINWKKIIKFSFSVAVFLFLILLFIYPITYSTSVSILPPNDQPQGLSGLLGTSDVSPLLSLTGNGGDSQLYAEILKSRSAKEIVINKCGLINFFEIDDTNSQLQQAVKELSDKIFVDVTKEGIIIFSTKFSTGLFARFSSARDSVNNLSAFVSNTFVEALDEINREKMNSRAKKTRKYLEIQLQLTKLELDSLENELKIFQERNKAISLPAQIEAAIVNAAEVKSQIILAEIQLNSISQNMQSNNQSILSLENKLKVLKSKYSDLVGREDDEKDYFPKFADVPEISYELVKIKRNLEVQNQVYLLLQKQYFTEKIQENKDIPTIQVLDKAIPALKPTSPRLLFHTFVGTVFAFLLISTIIVFIENKQKNMMSKSK